MMSESRRLPGRDSRRGSHTDSRIKWTKKAVRDNNRLVAGISCQVTWKLPEISLTGNDIFFSLIVKRFFSISDRRLTPYPAKVTRKAPAIATIMPTIRGRVMASCRKIAANTKTNILLVWFNAAAVEACVYLKPASQSTMEK